MAQVQKFLLLSLLIIPTILTSTTSACSGASPRFGNMTKDLDLEVGSTLTITCSLHNHVISDNSSEYYVTSDNLMIKYGNIFLENLEVVDPLTVQYVVPNATVNDTGYYFCFLSIPELTYNPFICTTYVAVGYPPLPVNNFSCISLHFKTLNCSWEKPFNPVRTTYELYDYYPSEMFKRKCPISSVNSCEWRLDTKPPYRQQPRQLMFVLTANNSLGKKKQYFSVQHFKIVKPAEPKQMMFTNVTKHSLQVHWLPPKGMEFGNLPPGLEYWLHYCPTIGFYPNLCGVINVRNLTSCVVNDLVPYTEYLFSLRCRSNAAESEEMWSPFLNATVRTKPDVPYLAPETSSSSFEVQHIQESRSITLYWKPIPAVYQNGKDFTYVISYQPHYMISRIKREIVEVEVANATSHTFRKLSQESAYLFRLYARNSLGPSLNVSVMTVDKASNLIKGPEDISVLSYGQGKYTVSWKLAEMYLDDSVENFTLFWCPSIKPRPFSCKGPIMWKEVSGTHHELNLSDLHTNYQFAVSSRRDHYVSGMKWASCVVPYRGVLYKINDVVLTPRNSTSIRVHWILDCKAQKSVIQEYAIIYCPVFDNSTCSNPSKTISFHSPMSEQHIVGGLQPYTMYMFVIQARTADGWSESSDRKFESTLSAAPSDPPRHVKVVQVNGTVIKIAFKPPLHPNGEISRYSVMYRKASATYSESHTINILAGKQKEIYVEEIQSNNVEFYTNYSLAVEACVQPAVSSTLACSPLSMPVYAMTGIGIPGPLDPPHAEIINATLVNVSWKHPPMPNGPINMYNMTMSWHEAEDGEDKVRTQFFMISGEENFLSVPVVCENEIPDGQLYFFSIQAVNIKNGTHLWSEPSGITQTRLCFLNFGGMSVKLVIGLVIGAAVALTCVVAAVLIFVKWAKRKIDMVKGITVQLPSGLDSPIENPLSSYDKFKNGLIKNRDAGIPFEHTYERLCSYASDKAKDLEKSYVTSSEEFLNAARSCRGKSGRNQSGDSNVSNKGHDSISSSNTNKTHLSIDSGAEMDLPPSPDTVPSNTSSSNTTPRSYKPDLDIVEETNALSSKDSGLDKESFIHSITCQKALISSPRCLSRHKKHYHTYFKNKVPDKMVHYEPYSKFAMIAPAFAPKYISIGPQSRTLMRQQSLANSEPSVNEFEEDYSEPLVPGVPPYCKFGLARSAGNVLNLTHHVLPVQSNLGYSKFGIIYGALGSSEYGKNHNMLNQNSPKTMLSKKESQNPLVFDSHSKCGELGVPIMESEGKPKKVDIVGLHKEMHPGANVTFSEVATILGSPEVHVNNKPIDAGFHNGQNTSQNIDRKGPPNGYVSFNHALSSSFVPSRQNVHSGAIVFANQVIGPVSIVNTDEDLPNLSAICPETKKADLGQSFTPTKPSGYVSFQDAKGMPVIELQDSISPYKEKPTSSDMSNDVSQRDLDIRNVESDAKCEASQDLKDSLTYVQTMPESTLPANGAHSTPIVHHSKTMNAAGRLDVTSDSVSAQISTVPLDVEPSEDIEEPESCDLNSKSEAPVSLVCNKVAPSNGYVAWNELLTGDSMSSSAATKVVTLPNVVSSKMYIEHV